MLYKAVGFLFNNMENQGWVSIHRKIQDNELWLSEKFTRSQAWIDLILLANHKPGDLYVRGNLIKLKRGDVGWSEVTLAKRWRWSRDKVRRFLEDLETRHQIIQQKNRVLTIKTILNYDTYQTDNTPSKTPDKTTEKHQKNIRQDTNNNNNNENNKNNNTLQSEIADNEGIVINKIISLFEPVNPSYGKLFKNVTQRQACSRLLKIYPEEELTAIINFLPKFNAEQFLPVSTTPLQLEDNLGKYKAHSERLKTNKYKTTIV